jgi:type 1 glutamine amidotransferase
MFHAPGPLGSFLKSAAFAAALLASGPAGPGLAAAPIKVLFLGDKGHHNPAALHKVLAPAFAAQGIQLDYSEKPSDLDAPVLSGYAALALYNNIDTLSAARITSLFDFVNGGKGILVIHCGIVMALLNPRLDTLYGGRFVRHDTGVFRPRIIDAAHAAMQGVETFSAWDETYEHRFVGAKTVLMERAVAGGKAEPWTWVRNQGKGRVYYTASGHDARVWNMAAYQKQLIVGLYWTMGKDPVSLRSGPSRAAVGSATPPGDPRALRVRDGRLEWIGLDADAGIDAQGRALPW